MSAHIENGSAHDTIAARGRVQPSASIDGSHQSCAATEDTKLTAPTNARKRSEALPSASTHDGRPRWLRKNANRTPRSRSTSYSGAMKASPMPAPIRWAAAPR